MSGMVERVGLALQNINLDLGGVRANLSEAKAKELARAAIEEMREPTPEMVKAGEFPTREIPLGNGTVAVGMGFGASGVSLYRKMIDVALKEF